MTINPAVMAVGDTVADHMNEILTHWKPGAKISVIVRVPGNNEADFMMSNDDPAQVVALLHRRINGEAGL